MHKKNNPDWPTSLSGFFVSCPLAYFPEKTNLLVCSYLVYSPTSKIKKSFFLFLPSHPHTCGSNALFIGGSRVRVSVRASDLPSHYPHTPLTLSSHSPHTILTLPPTLPARKLLVSDSMDVMKSFFREYEQWFIVSIAMPHCWCNYAALLVYLCWTVGIPMLHCWYTYAGLLVPVCYTFLVPFFHDVYSRRIDEQTC